MQEKREKIESDGMKAENIRKTAMEKVGDTQKRVAEDGAESTKPKRQRRRGSDTIDYLRSKSNSEFELRREELEVKIRQQELDEKKYEAHATQLNLQQVQQKDLVQKMEEQRQQSLDMQRMLLQKQQQQQQQNQTLMALIGKLIPQ